MKPHKIFIIKHGESIGNVDKKNYENIPDWKIPLTKRGKEQAVEMADIVFKKLDLEEGENKRRGDLTIYCSPWERTRMTALPLIEKFKKFKLKYYEDPRIREQEWGNLESAEKVKYFSEERKKYGTFFYRIPNGESGADVYDRVSTFLETLHRDFKRPSFSDNAAIISHGLTIKLFLMRWFHWTVEEYENYCNPTNCQIIELTLKNTGVYYITSPLAKRK